ncbi:MAG: sugar phosphate nucleotidyltransferase [bacterium]
MTHRINQAVILAAGFGSRMRHYCEDKPKAMLRVEEHTLIYFQIIRLAKIGVKNIYINASYQAEKLIKYIESLKIPHINLHVIFEGSTPLDTGGGLYNLIQHMSDEPFYTCNTDAWFDYNLGDMKLQKNSIAHLLLIPNHTQKGDFYIIDSTLSNNPPGKAYTFSGVSIMTPELIQKQNTKSFSIVPSIRKGIDNNIIDYTCTKTYWKDVGTPERYFELLNDIRTHLTSIP